MFANDVWFLTMKIYEVIAFSAISAVIFFIFLLTIVRNIVKIPAC